MTAEAEAWSPLRETDRAGGPKMGPDRRVHKAMTATQENFMVRLRVPVVLRNLADQCFGGRERNCNWRANFWSDLRRTQPHPS